MTPGTVFITIYFIHQWADKLDCYITLDWKGLLGTNTLAYSSFLSHEENEVL